MILAELIAAGTRVMLPGTDLQGKPIVGTVLYALVGGNRSIAYEVSWWVGRERRVAVVGESEVRVVVDDRETS